MSAARRAPLTKLPRDLAVLAAVFSADFGHYRGMWWCCAVRRGCCADRQGCAAGRPMRPSGPLYRFTLRRPDLAESGRARGDLDADGAGRRPGRPTSPPFRSGTPLKGPDFGLVLAQQDLVGIRRRPEAAWPRPRRSGVSALPMQLSLAAPHDAGLSAGSLLMVGDFWNRC